MRQHALAHRHISVGLRSVARQIRGGRLLNQWSRLTTTTALHTTDVSQRYRVPLSPSMPPKAKVTPKPAAKSPAKALPDDGLPIHSFVSSNDFETFLEENHSTLPGIHLKLAKKTSGIQTISASEAVETALCFGWIDGRANGLDHNHWLVRYTPRRAKSIWSQKNVSTVARLIEEGRMRESGLQAVEAAKQDGRWDRAYAGPATVQVPEDLKVKLEEVPAAKAFFEGLNKSDRYSVLWRVETCSPQNRTKRIDALVQILATGNVPGATAKAMVGSIDNKTDKKKVGRRNAAERARGK